MQDILNEEVLVLNRFWQAVNVRPAHKVMKALMSGRVVAMVRLDDDGNFEALNWEQWLERQGLPSEKYINTISRKICVPRTVLLINYDKLPKKNLKLTSAAIKARDKTICQYTGEFAPDGNIDHVIPRSRGGKDTWENMVWCKASVNLAKGDKLPEECGLKLLRKPVTPLPKFASMIIKVPADKLDWRWFIEKYRIGKV